jgi:hypothetical protein
VTGIALNTPVNSGLLPVNDFNVPVTVSFANPTTGTIDPMGSVSVAVGGVSTPITLGTTTVTLNPGDTFQLFGSTGGTNNKEYGISVTIGTATPQEWYVKTTPTAPSIGTPQIQTPGNNTTGVGTPTGIQISGDAYDPLNGAGAQSSSTWEVYTGGYPLGPSTNTISVVTPGTAGTPATIQWKTSSSSDTNPNSRNEVYGKLATDQFTGTTYPAFNWAKGLNIGGFTDWYIPAKNELEILYYNLKPTTTTNSNFNAPPPGNNPNAIPPRTGYNSTASPATNPAQTTNALFQSGGSEAFTTADACWSSTESSINPSGAWTQFFGNGVQGNGFKNNSLYARAIRRIPIAEYTAAGSPAIGSYLKGGFYGGQISTAGNGTADYALIVAPAAQGEYGYTGGTNASLTIAGANTDGFQVGMTIKGAPSNATGIILSINATTIQYLPTSGTFAFGDTISTDPASYSQISGSPFTVTTSPLESLTVPKPPLAANTKYYVRVRYSTTTPSAIDSDWSPWSGFTTGNL